MKARSVADLLKMPQIKAALARPMKINNDHCIPYGAGRSKDDEETFVDKHVPRYDPRFKIAGGKNGDIWKYVDIHEKTEFAAMTELGMHYLKAHLAVATPLERHFVEKDGGNWKRYEEVWGGFLDETEHDHDDDMPEGLYMGPYDHAAAHRIEGAVGRVFKPYRAK